MTNYNFEFHSAYTGKWKIDGIEETPTGTLTITNNSILLEVLFQDCHMTSINEYFDISGDAYNIDGGKSEQLSFVLKNARLQYTSLYRCRLNRVIFDIKSLIAYTSGDEDTARNLNNISNCGVHMFDLDRWLAPIYREGCEISDNSFETEYLELVYSNPKTWECYEDETIRIYIRYAYSYDIPNGYGFKLTHKAFLNVQFKTPNVKQSEARHALEKIINFFFLIWNDILEPEYIVYREQGNNYWEKRSLKYSHHHVDNRQISFRTDFNDYGNEDTIGSYIKKWILIYKDWEGPLAEYFDILYNESSYHSTKLKSLVSVIDGLTKKLQIKGDGIMQDSPKKQRIISLFDKIEGLNMDEKNFLKTQALRDKGNSIQQRFDQLIIEVKDLVDYIPNDLSLLTINTRHRLTHSDGRITNVLDEDKYPVAVLILENVIRAYLMKLIGIENKVIKKAIQLYGNISLSSN